MSLFLKQKRRVEYGMVRLSIYTRDARQGEVLHPVREKGPRVCFGPRNMSSSSNLARERILDSRLARGMKINTPIGESVSFRL